MGCSSQIAYKELCQHSEKYAWIGHILALCSIGSLAKYQPEPESKTYYAVMALDIF